MNWSAHQTLHICVILIGGSLLSNFQSQSLHDIRTKSKQDNRYNRHNFTAIALAESIKEIRNEALWAKAYIIPQSNNTSEQGVALVIYQDKAWEVRAGSNSGCEIRLPSYSSTDSLVLTRHNLVTTGNGEDRSNHHTYRVECFFTDDQVKTYLLSDVSDDKIVRFHGVETTVISALSLFPPSREKSSLTMCIPTLFGKNWERPSFWIYVDKYLQHLQKFHSMKHLFWYTTNINAFHALVSFAFTRQKYRPSLDIAPIFIPAMSAKSHYRNQRLAIFDCWYRALSIEAEWVMFGDVDEILTWPFGSQTWAEVFSPAVTSISFPSWSYNETTGTAAGANCKMNWMGRRKYAIRGLTSHFYGQTLSRPGTIHEAECKNEKALHGSGGMRLEHINLNRVLALCVESIRGPLCNIHTATVHSVYDWNCLFQGHWNYTVLNPLLQLPFIGSAVKKRDSVLFC